MNKVLQNSLIVLGGFALGMVGFYVFTNAQSDTDTVTATITIPATVTIADDGDNFSIANLAPGAVDSSQSNVLDVASNSGTGFNVTVDIADLDGTPGQLCVDNAGSCDLGAGVFDTDNGTGASGSRVSVNSTGAGGTLGTLPGATFLPTDTNLGATPVQIYTTTGRTNSNVLNVFYKAFVDFLVAANTYEGTITFTITAQ